MRHQMGDDQRVAATLARYGLVEDASWRDDGRPEWKITTDGRIAADRSRAGKPEICFRCDKGIAVYVSFSGAQTGEDIGYPAAHLLCQRCYDDDHRNFPGIPKSRTYRMTPVFD